ncbi:c-type cytochrome [Varunaivibrio sulfuroxidans]|uniref:Cytochrome c n=1 Tax=Varunaivibrio sulfuroxidans TaxID=1773489 RepID=A0A4V2UNN1_9PROT|nr:c-type cytochrome [Varunaivibrio sulfuroxidans]TCS62631.1 cytochrome c [Varunaivibrio sulfuroxidans]WES30702.1 c-type cytochrome [Varunaivibrio sulfuroxidans]
MKNKTVLGLLMAATVAFSASSAMAASKGEKLFKHKCSVCHKIDKNAVGPMLKGVIGRKAGSVASFSRYNAMKGANFTWNEALISEWITNQRKFLKTHKDMVGGSRTAMIVHIKKEKDRKAIIDYLKTAQ